MISVDIAIIGAGCVGLTAALGLAKKGFSVAIIDSAGGEIVLTEPQSRVSAISKASENIFKNLGVWSLLQQARITPYDKMEVREKHSFANISFGSDLVNQSHLGHIIENNNIRNALLTAVKYQPNIQLLLNSQCNQIHNNVDQVLLQINTVKSSNDQTASVNNNSTDDDSESTPLICKLLVGADGANSFVRQQANLPITFSDYNHHALVTTIKTELPHNNTARQVFLPTGPLAFLPLFCTENNTKHNDKKSESNLCSIVWSTSPEQAALLRESEPSDLAKAITAASDSELGVVEVVGDVASFPLTMRYARKWVNNRIVIMGDAAHTIHPLAGLGMNLGLLDAASLVQVLSDAKTLDVNCYSQYTLGKYERWRKAQALEFIVAMEGLKRLFEGNNPIQKLGRGLGLNAANNISPVKQTLVKQAMGVSGHLPELAK